MILRITFYTRFEIKTHCKTDKRILNHISDCLYYVGIDNNAYHIARTSYNATLL